MSVSTLLDQTLTIERQATSMDASGGTGRTFATVLPNVPFAVGAARPSVIADYARRDMVVNYHLYTTTDLDALITGGIKLGDRVTDGSRYYLVKGVRKSANRVVTSEVLYQFDCELGKV